MRGRNFRTLATAVVTAAALAACGGDGEPEDAGMEEAPAQPAQQQDQGAGMNIDEVTSNPGIDS